jgi:Flp pilus assembly protein TadG
MKYGIHNAWKSRCRRAGSSIVEFAVGSGILLAAFTGTFQFGYTFIQYNRLETAVSQGTRYASLAPYDSATSTPSSQFLATFRNMVLYGSPAQGAAPVVAGLTTGNVTLIVAFRNGVPSTVTVAITNYTVNSLFGTSRLTGKPKSTYPYQGIWTPI